MHEGTTAIAKPAGILRLHIGEPPPRFPFVPNLTNRFSSNQQPKRLQNHFNFQISSSSPQFRTQPPTSNPKTQTLNQRHLRSGSRSGSDGVRGSGGATAGDVRRRHREAIRRHGRVRRPLRPRLRPLSRPPRQRRQVEPHQSVANSLSPSLTSPSQISRIWLLCFVYVRISRCELALRAIGICSGRPIRSGLHRYVVGLCP